MSSLNEVHEMKIMSSDVRPQVSCLKVLNRFLFILCVVSRDWNCDVSNWNLKFWKRWRFKSRPSGLWRCLVLR